jgi:tripartite-type tricarboxylate transporter receptor subunit TctC
LKAVMAIADVQQQIIKLGMVPVVSEPPEALQAFINSEMMRWGNVVRQAGLAGSEG